MIGIPRSWEPFVQGICPREKFPGFNMISLVYIQEETQLMSKDDTDGLVSFMPKRSSFRSIMVLRFREGNVHRMRGQPMCPVANRSRETDEEEKVAPLVMR